MERFFASGEDSPLRMLPILESNLKRERQIIAIAAGLLILVVVCAATTTYLALLSATLAQEQVLAHVMTRSIDASIVSRYDTLTTGRLLLELSGQGLLSPASQARLDIACEMDRSGVDSVIIRLACDDAIQQIPRHSDRAALQFALFDASASYGHGFFSSPAAASKAGNDAGKVAILVASAKAVMAAREIDVLAAAREGRTMSFAAPLTLGLPPHTLVAFAIVARSGQPYALVFTRIDLELVLADLIPAPLESNVALFDARGRFLAGDASDSIFHAQKHLSASRAGAIVWMPGHGWAGRSTLLASELGYFVFALPVLKHLWVTRTQNIVIVLVTAALIGGLLAAYRYWSYRFLTRTYDQARRALEGDILNHLLVHATPVGLCIVQRNDFSIVAANPLTRDVLDMDDAFPRLPLGLCKALEQSGLSHPSGNRDTDIQQFLYSLRRDDRADIHLKISYAPVMVNKLDVLFCAIADVTEQHEAETMLRAAKETSDAAVKTQLNFFASMSHEIRTPLASLTGNLELVALSPLAAEQRARVLAMQASASGLLQVVNDVLDFSKMDIGELRLSEEWGSIRELVLGAAVAHAPLANRQQLKLFVVVQQTCPDRFLFDPIRTSQILSNLIGNSLKFTPSGKIVVRLSWVNSVLELSVSDSGIGIPEASRRRLFQPFAQGDSLRIRAQGTGLGLSICARLTELMKGHIALESTEGIGTRITVSLPLRADESNPRANDARLSQVQAGILCQANEYREWFDNLYPPTHASHIYPSLTESANLDTCRYLVATDEFSARDIASVWHDSSRVIRVTQDGPLIPALREDGALEVSLFSLDGFIAAVQMLTGRSHQSLETPLDHGDATAPLERTSGQTVLIVEDNRLNRMLLEDQLIKLGAKVLVAEDGEQALEVLGAHRVQIVLTDMDMPKMTGAELLRAIRAFDHAIPVYAISASASVHDVERGRLEGFTDYLTKPVKLAELARVLQRAAGEHTLARVDPGDGIEDDVPPRFPVVPIPYLNAFLRQIDEDLVALDVIHARRDACGLGPWAHKISGGLAILGASNLGELCGELRAALRDSEDWSDDVETFTMLVRNELIELRNLHRAAGHR